jgi:hypothetical protein
MPWSTVPLIGGFLCVLILFVLVGVVFLDGRRCSEGDSAAHKQTSNDRAELIVHGFPLLVRLLYCTPYEGGQADGACIIAAAIASPDITAKVSIFSHGEAAKPTIGLVFLNNKLRQGFSKNNVIS